jgi:hypothetical protein
VAGANEEAWSLARILIKHACVDHTVAQVLGDQRLFDSVWRETVRRTHPDTNNGRDDGVFRSVIAARGRIKALKGW